jgi:hypothetical protein
VASTLDALKAFLQGHRVARKFVPGEFEAFEKALHERVMGVERDLLRDEIAAADIDAEAIVVESKTVRRVQERTDLHDSGGRCRCRAMALQGPHRRGEPCRQSARESSRFVDFWTPHAAKQALWVVTQMTPGKSEEMFQRIGNMTPSKSSLDRLPKTLSKSWEADREQFEETLRSSLQIPEEATTVVVSLDGVLAPFEDAQPVEKRARAADEGRMCKGPVGYKEVACGTLSFCDAEGEMIAAVRIARSPEWKKMSLKASLAAELAAVLRARPDLRIVKIADTGGNNWEFLSGDLPPGEEAVDFFHSAEHLHEAVANAYGDATRETRHRFEVLRDALRDEEAESTR